MRSEPGAVPCCLPVASQADVAQCVLASRRAARDVGLDATDQSRFASAVSELAQNVIRYAERGQLVIRRLRRVGRSGVEAVVTDAGPGIANLQRALQDHMSSGGGLGLGLPGTQRMMDDFDIETTLGRGTRVTIRLWRRR